MENGSINGRDTNGIPNFNICLTEHNLCKSTVKLKKSICVGGTRRELIDTVQLLPHVIF